MHRGLLTGLLLVLVLALAAASPLAADTISLAWDPVAHPTLTGYRVYHGPSPGNYTQVLDTGLATQAIVSGLGSCTTRYLAVKAVAADGSESALFSNEVSGWPRPIVTQAAPSSIQRGSSAVVTLSGANFRSGVVVSVSNPGVSVGSVNVGGCNSLSVTLTASANAALGSFDIRVTDPDGIVGTGSAIAAVTADTAAPVIGALSASSVGSTTATIGWTTDEPADGRVFFRPVGAASYQSSALAATLTTAHDVALTGLSPSTAYEYYVESADGNGNLATANGTAPFTTGANGFTYMRFEAEAGPLTAPAEASPGTDAFGGAWAQLEQGTPTGTPGSPSGSWDYGFVTPGAGTWHVWLRMYGVNNSANAWFEGVDGGSLAAVEPPQNGVWQWVAARSYALGAGQHTLTLGGAEARARIDRVLVTDDPNFLPSEQPGSDTTPPAAVGGLAATPADGEVTLAWTNPPDADVARVVVRYRDDGITPVSVWDGLSWIDRPAVAGAADGGTHSGLTNGIALSYAVFVIDSEGNVSPAAAIGATPETQTNPPEQVQNLHRTDTQ